MKLKAQQPKEEKKEGSKKGLFRNFQKKVGNQKDEGRQKKAKSVDGRNDEDEVDARKQMQTKRDKTNSLIPHVDSESLSGKFSVVMGEKKQMSATYNAFGSDPFDVMKVVQEDTTPSPLADNHVVVKVQASSVTLGDCMLRRGFSFELLNPVGLPAVPGHDVVGFVVSRGPAVADFKEGDRVAALIRTGGNARYVSVEESSLVKVPLSIDAAEAAAMPTCFMTAYQAIRAATDEAPMFSMSGKKVLVLGAMDSTAQALIQLCVKGKADVFATGPSQKHGFMRNSLGVTPLPEESSQWLTSVENEMDMVFDGVCQSPSESRRALKDDGKLVCFGQSSMLESSEMGIFGAPLSARMNKFMGLTRSNTTMFDLWESFRSDPETYKKNLKSLFQLLKWDKIKPSISRRLTLSEVAKAHEKLEAKTVRGVLVCIPWKRVSPKAVDDGNSRES